MKAKSDDLPKQPRRQTIVHAIAPNDGADFDRIAMVSSRSQNIAELGEEMYSTKGHPPPSVPHDMSPEAGLRYTPENTTPRRFDNDGYSLRANGLPDGVWWKLPPREVRAFAVVTCYNGHGEKVWEETPVSIIIDIRAIASQSMLDFCQNKLGVLWSEVGPSLGRLSPPSWTLFLHLETPSINNPL